MIFASQCLFRTYYEFYYERASQDMAACLTQPKPHGAVRQLYIFVRKLRTTHGVYASKLDPHAGTHTYPECIDS